MRRVPGLAVAFVITVPVKRWLIARGKGHAVVHQYHQDGVGQDADAGRSADQHQHPAGLHLGDLGRLRGLDGLRARPREGALPDEVWAEPLPS